MYTYETKKTEKVASKKKGSMPNRYAPLQMRANTNKLSYYEHISHHNTKRVVQKRQEESPDVIQCYGLADVKQDIEGSKWSDIATKIASCSKAELDNIYAGRLEIVAKKTNFSNEQFATVVGHIIARENKDSIGSEAGQISQTAYDELLRILTIQLNNKDVAENMINQKVLITAKDKALTDYSEYAVFKDQKVDSTGRTWNTTRGAGAYRYPSATDTVDGKVPSGAREVSTTAIAEENLINVGSSYKSFTKYPAGYSTTTHEFAHTIHEFGLSESQRKTVQTLFNAFKLKSEPRTWVDGPEKDPTTAKGPCYASTNAREYLAQSSNAYLGTNVGNDSATGLKRNNGRDWLAKNDKDMLTLLDEVYAQQTEVVSDTVKAGGQVKYVNDIDIESGALSRGVQTNPN